MVDSVGLRSRICRWTAVPLVFLVATPLAAGETLVFKDGFDLVECSAWSATSNPLGAPDGDDDGYGDASQPTVYCQLPPGFVGNAADCDDGLDYVYPGAVELCNGIDDDCDELDDEDFDCVQSEIEQCGVTDLGACQYGTRTCSSECSWGSCDGNIDPEPEICDDLDNDCDGSTDAADGDLVLPLCEAQLGVCMGATKPAPLCSMGEWSSCTDFEYGAHSASYETVETSCDGLDNDCDGETDEGCLPPLSCTSIIAASTCTNGAVSQLDLGTLTAADCRSQCQFLMPQAGMTSGCWILVSGTTCYCRSGVLNVGGSSPGGSCS